MTYDKNKKISKVETDFKSSTSKQIASKSEVNERGIHEAPPPDENQQVIKQLGVAPSDKNPENKNHKHISASIKYNNNSTK